MTVKGWGKVKTSANYCDTGERTFRDYLNNGLKHSRLPSGTILVKFSDIDAYLEKFAVQANVTDKIVNDVMKDFKGKA